MNQGLIIKILGSIAAGKSTLAQGLAEDLDLDFVAERPESNPFLERMTENPARWCFTNQVWYLLEAKDSLRVGHKNGCILDHSTEEIVEIHNRVFREWGWLDDEESSMLRSLGSSDARDPDLYICLNAPPLSLVERVHARGRGNDRLPEVEYLDQVAKARQSFLEGTRVPVLQIRSDLVDFRSGAQRASITTNVRRLLPM